MRHITVMLSVYTHNYAYFFVVISVVVFTTHIAIIFPVARLRRLAATTFWIIITTWKSTTSTCKSFLLKSITTAIVHRTTVPQTTPILQGIFLKINIVRMYFNKPANVAITAL